jgi:hypothetical protein
MGKARSETIRRVVSRFRFSPLRSLFGIPGIAWVVAGSTWWAMMPRHYLPFAAPTSMSCLHHDYLVHTVYQNLVVAAPNEYEPLTIANSSGNGNFVEFRLWRVENDIPDQFWIRFGLLRPFVHSRLFLEYDCRNYRGPELEAPDPRSTILTADEAPEVWDGVGRALRHREELELADQVEKRQHQWKFEWWVLREDLRSLRVVAPILIVVLGVWRIVLRTAAGVREERRRRGLCTECEYAVAASGVGVCPECGRASQCGVSGGGDIALNDRARPH